MIVKEAIILAAGLGTRMRKSLSDLPKPLVRICNIPLIAYPLAALLGAGVEQFYIVVNNLTLEPISRLVDELGLNAELVFNECPERGNGYSLLLGLQHVKSELFFLSMSDHIYAPQIPLVLCDIAEDFDIVVGADSSPRYVDMEEATKILAYDDLVADIGKGLSEYTHADIGLFIMKRELRRIYQEYAEQEHVIELAALVKYAVESGKKVLVADIKGLPWIDIDTIEDLYRAESEARDLIEESADLVHRYVYTPCRVSTVKDFTSESTTLLL